MHLNIEKTRNSRDNIIQIIFTFFATTFVIDVLSQILYRSKASEFTKLPSIKIMDAFFLNRTYVLQESNYVKIH